MNLRFGFILLSLFYLNLLPAQRQIFNLDGGKKKIDIHFEYENNFIVLDLVFNRVLPLKFLFDTGAEYTILAKKEFSDMLSVDYERTFRIVGADLKSDLIAYLAKSIDLKISKFKAYDQNILVLSENYLKFEEFAGLKVDGILGADIFKNFVVKVNYKKQVITLYEPMAFEPPGDDYIEIPIQVMSNKPYIVASTQLRDTSSNTTIKLLLDTGAGLPLLLHTNTHPDLKLPPAVVPGNIGIGLGGFLEGYLGRVSKLNFSSFELNNVVSNFQEVVHNRDTTYLNGRNGILGNQILNRFTFIIDYYQNKLYLKPHKNWDRGFKYDRSGLVITASGPELKYFSIQSIVPGSPADLAGLKKGDEIKKINMFPVGFHNLSSITRKLQGRVGKKIRLVVRRKGQKMKFKFRLKDLI